DIDILSLHAENFARELQGFLAKRFHIAVRVREVGGGRAYRLFQVRKPHNRHLVDIRPVEALPPARRVAEVLVVEPEELIARKIMAFQRRRKTPKSGTDWRDLAALLLTFPELKRQSGPVAERLRAAGVGPEVFSAWQELVAQELQIEDEGDEF
ncbi:MAG: nucleotidyl transferase AbiEii/AbiGii toxin family protein, partial [Acidobacteriota bacterium]